MVRSYSDLLKPTTPGHCFSPFLTTRPFICLSLVQWLYSCFQFDVTAIYSSGLQAASFISLMHTSRDLEVKEVLFSTGRI